MHGEDFCLSIDHEAHLNAFLDRAVAHVITAPRAAQRWHNLVTDQRVAEIFFALEYCGVKFHRIRAGRWAQPRSGYRVADPSPIVNEMIRTGLLRHLVEKVDGKDVDFLIPAKIHLRDGQWSACRFIGEDLGPMRSRLLDDLSLVDCLDCEATVARGHARGL